MAIYDLFSKRQRRLRSQPSDVLSYNELPNALRTQILYIIGDSIGDQRLPELTFSITILFTRYF